MHSRVLCVKVSDIPVTSPARLPVCSRNEAAVRLRRHGQTPLGPSLSASDRARNGGGARGGKRDFRSRRCRIGPHSPVPRSGRPADAGAFHPAAPARRGSRHSWATRRYVRRRTLGKTRADVSHDQGAGLRKWQERRDCARHAGASHGGGGATRRLALDGFHVRTAITSGTNRSSAA
jgi:hypothetical protein